MRSEIREGFHDAGSEELRPKPIHHHARHERMVRLRQPPRQPEAIARSARGPRRQPLFRNARSHWFQVSVVISPRQYKRRARLRQFAHDHHLWQRPT